jgi:hypothetical protein
MRPEGGGVSVVGADDGDDGADQDCGAEQAGHAGDDKDRCESRRAGSLSLGRVTGGGGEWREDAGCEAWWAAVVDQVDELVHVDVAFGEFERLFDLQSAFAEPSQAPTEGDGIPTDGDSILITAEVKRGRHRGSSRLRG